MSSRVGADDKPSDGERSRRQRERSHERTSYRSNSPFIGEMVRNPLLRDAFFRSFGARGFMRAG